MPVNSAAGYCACGCEIWIEYLNSGGKWFCRFTDQAGQEITVCPECGKELTEDGLESI